MPEAAPVFAEITASELRGSRGKVMPGLKPEQLKWGFTSEQTARPRQRCAGG